MGGWGSTRWAGHARRREIGEGTRRLSLRALDTALWLVRSPRTGGDGVDVFERVDDGCVLRGRLRPWRDADGWRGAVFDGCVSDAWGRGWLACRVTFVARAQPRGGVSWLLRCPQCAVRRRALYIVPASTWACRECLGLCYPVQRWTPVQRLEHRAQRVRRLAGGTARDDERGTFPARPKPYRWYSRFERLRAIHDDAIETLDAIRFAPFARFLVRNGLATLDGHRLR